MMAKALLVVGGSIFWAIAGTKAFQMDTPWVVLSTLALFLALIGAVQVQDEREEKAQKAGAEQAS